MIFDGVVGDLIKSDKDVGVVWDAVYVGKNDKDGMKKFIDNEAKLKGIEVLSLVMEEDGEKLKCFVKFRGMRGIV